MNSQYHKYICANLPLLFIHALQQCLVHSHQNNLQASVSWAKETEVEIVNTLPERFRMQLHEESGIWIGRLNVIGLGGICSFWSSINPVSRFIRCKYMVYRYIIKGVHVCPDVIMVMRSATKRTNHGHSYSLEHLTLANQYQLGFLAPGPQVPAVTKREVGVEPVHQHEVYLSFTVCSRLLLFTWRSGSL